MSQVCFFVFSLFLLVRMFFLFLPVSSYPCAKPLLSPPFHPHSLLSDCRSVQVGCTRFSRCCYLIIDLGSPLAKGTGPGIVAVTCSRRSSSAVGIPSLFFPSSCFSQFSTEKFRARIAQERRIANSVDPEHPLFCGELFTLGHGAQRLVAIAQWFVHLCTHPQPMQQYR